MEVSIMPELRDIDRYIVRHRHKGRSVQRPKQWEYGNEDEDNSLNNVNNASNHNTSSQRYRQIYVGT